MENSKIEWLDGGHSWSPWIGCQAVSDACDHCYAEALVERYGGDFSLRRRTSASYWHQLTKWNKQAAHTGTRVKIFPSMCDPFDNQVPDIWRWDMWDIIEGTPHLDYLLLTKRPQNIRPMLPIDKPWGKTGWPNVWLGTTTENQTEADRRIRHLVDIPAVVHFLSVEPMLGPIDLGLASAYVGHGIQWVIAGGESGPKDRRRVNLAHMRDLRDQCKAAGIPFFGKQDDKIHDLPADLMVREFPEAGRK